MVGKAPHPKRHDHSQPRGSQAARESAHRQAHTQASRDDNLRQKIVRALTPAKIDKLLREQLPYSWMSSIELFKELSDASPNIAWAKDTFALMVRRSNELQVLWMIFQRGLNQISMNQSPNLLLAFGQGHHAFQNQG